MKESEINWGDVLFGELQGSTVMFQAGQTSTYSVVALRGSCVFVHGISRSIDGTLLLVTMSAGETHVEKYLWIRLDTVRLPNEEELAAYECLITV